MGQKGTKIFQSPNITLPGSKNLMYALLWAKYMGKKKFFFFSEKISGNGPEHVLKLRSVVACTDARYHLRGHAL